jgi:hypothetical protein
MVPTFFFSDLQSLEITRGWVIEELSKKKDCGFAPYMVTGLSHL